MTLSQSDVRVLVGGTTGEMAVQATSLGGYETTVRFECLDLPADTSCLFSPESATLVRAGTARASFIISAGPAAPVGVYSIEVLARDDSYSAQANLTLGVYVTPPNRPPVADAGMDGTYSASTPEGERVSLWGWNSYDPDGDTLTYTWTGPFPEGGGTVTGVSPTVTLVPGVHTITLVVSDGEYTSTDSVRKTVTDFSISVAQTSATVKAGQTASYTINIAPQVAGYYLYIWITCSNLPTKATCSSTPPYVETGEHATSATLQVATTAPSLSSPRSLRPLGGIGVRPETMWLTLGWLALFAAALALGYSRRRRLVWRFALGFVAGYLLWLSACGGGGGNAGGPHRPPPTPTPGTPPGTYTITVTGTGGSRQKSTTVTMTVQ